MNIYLWNERAIRVLEMGFYESQENICCSGLVHSLKRFLYKYTDMCNLKHANILPTYSRLSIYTYL